LLLGLFGPALFAQSAAAPPPYGGLWDRLQKAFESRDLEAYGADFTPGIRDRERRLASDYWDQWKMKTVLYRTSGRLKNEDGRERVYLQVFYQNDQSAMLEIWQALPVEEEGRWRIGEKIILGNVTKLYKVLLPSSRVERAARFEVAHQDIALSFENATIYYDNLPDVETALIVIGDGRLRFSPSSEIERHQLSLRYGTSVLEDRLEWAYLRFSNDFFRNRVKIAGTQPSLPLSDATRAQANSAYALFSRRYTESFTIRNSLTDELLSFLPQGDQVVFDFKAKRSGELTYIYSPFSEEEIHFIGRDPDRVINLYSPETSGETGKRMYVTFGQKVDVVGYEIDVDFQPSTLRLSARARVDIAARFDSVDSLNFNLHSDLDILKVFDRDGRELFYTQDKSRSLLYIYLLRPLEKGVTSSVEVYYRGRLKPLVQTADVLSGGQLNETISFAGTRFETYLYSLADLWYPAPSGEDFFQAKVRIIVPPGYSCIANGIPTDQGKVNGFSRVTSLDKVGNPYFGFETKAPVKYLSFIVGRFSPITNGHGPESAVPVQALVATGLRAPRRSLLDDAKKILQAFESWFGSYPFERLTVIDRPWVTAGGHSPASFIVLNELPRSPDSPLMAEVEGPVNLGRWKEAYLAHEIAHQWWGQGVTCATYRDQWLSEGLAQFASALFLRQTQGEDVFRSILKKFARWTVKKSKWGPITLGVRLSQVDYDAYQALVYNKSALAMGMILDLVGEDAFFRGLRDFFAAFRGRAARTSNFVKVMSTAAGRDLQPFFDKWFDSYVLPTVLVAPSVAKEGDGVTARFRVTQVGPSFVFPLWVSWEENGKVVRRRLDVDAAVKEFEFPCGAHPAKIKIDPDGIFPGRLN
jgi:hypothetical protein